MNTFFQGILVKKEEGASATGVVYDRWLRVQIAPGIEVPVFDRGSLSVDLVPGNSYAFVLLIATPLSLQIEKKASGSHDLQVILRSTIVSIDGLSRNAQPIKVEVRDYPICGIVRDLSWHAPLTDSLSVASELRERRFLSIETAFGLVLMDWESLEQHEQASIQVGDMLTWNCSQLDLLGILPTLSTKIPEIAPRILRGSDEEIVSRMAGRPFVDILREGGAIWNRWRHAVVLHGQLNLSAVDLTAFDLSGVNLSLANLAGANLTNANLSDAHLERANLGSVILDRAILRQAQLIHASLDTASLVGADCTGANLQEASLWCANLSGTYLSEANLQEADLSDANLQGADLQGADLSEAILDNTNLVEAHYTKEQLAQAASSNGVHI